MSDTISNPIVDAISTDELTAILVARGVKVVLPKESAVEVEKTPHEILTEAVTKLVKVVDGALVVTPVAELSEDDKMLFDALSAKARTTAKAIAALHKPVYTGKKRGPKSKAELEAEAKAQAEAATPEQTDTQA